jgi:hypothetical protein
LRRVSKLVGRDLIPKKHGRKRKAEYVLCPHTLPGQAQTVSLPAKL